MTWTGTGRHGLVAAGFSVVLLAAGTPLAAASAVPTSGQAFGGFSSGATATPLRIEVHDPSIPIPSDPQVELNAFYSHVQGTSGPDASARASALWPGDAVGTGFKTMGDQFGLPSQLTAQGYPLQANASTPGGPGHASQEPMPGLVTRTSSDRQHSRAMAGISPDGDSSGQPSSSPSPAPGLPQLPGGPGGTKGSLGGLSGGGLSALGKALTGSSSAGASTPTTPNPLGALGVLASADEVSSLSSTHYSGHTVTSRATSTIQDLRLLGGVVTLHDVRVVSGTTSSLKGSRTSHQARFAGLSIGGQSFTVGPDGVRAAGKRTALPGLPDSPAKALEALGISFGAPRAKKSGHGSQASMSVRGLRITVDTSVLRAKLPSLPLAQLVNQMPDSAAQLKSVLGLVVTAAPRFVIYVGNAESSADTVAAPPPPKVSSPATGSPSPGAGAGTGHSGGVTGGGSPSTGGTSPSTGGLGSGTPAGAAPPPTVNTEVRPASASPGMPPLGSIPTLLCLAGLALAGGAGWALRRTGMVLLGANTTCSHGLKSGVPDLRKM